MITGPKAAPMPPHAYETRLATESGWMMADAPATAPMMSNEPPQPHFAVRAKEVPGFDTVGNAL